MSMLEDKPSLESLSLQHFGVKGMKWGVVKNRAIGGTADRILYGKKGIANLEEKVASGLSNREARRTQLGRAAVRASIAIYGALVLKNFAQVGVNTAVLSKAGAFTAQGEKQVLAISAKAMATKFAKKRGGSYVITTLS